ncbi:hypothetical protein SAMN02745176_03109 [Lutispora thermophila DSM 19022]|uniref:Uncharacterized protein n=1 Tax=Lutispora thermophila DSM 19022 TaxID=1122184 RepID=A0A1M6I7J6_9FIRM|nr:hypothetical protein SAMN02745176_03109 [Lutispora thermophila DSM 19022]
MYFTSKLVENKLLERIKKDLSFVDNSILEFRVLSELGYIISSQLQAMKTAKYQINEEVVEVITKRYSEFYWTYVNILDTKTRIYYADFLAISSHC